MRYKTKKFLKNVEAKAKVTSVAVLMMAVALSSMFVLFPSEEIIVCAEQPPVNYIYTEDFEGDSEGDFVNSSNPDESWYNFTRWYWGESIDLSHTNITDVSGNMVIKGDSVPPNAATFLFNLTDSTGAEAGINVSYVSFWVKVDTITTDQYLGFVFFSDASLDGGDYMQKAEIDTGGNVKVYNGNGGGGGTSGSYDNGAGMISADTWHHFNVSFNYTDNKHKTAVDGVEITDSGNPWFGFRDNGTTMVNFGVYAHADQDMVFQLNNYTVGSPVQMGSSEAGEDASEFGIIDSYLDSGLLKWSGDASTTTYSNETSGAGNNVTIYTNVNVSENCTDIYIDLSGDTTFGAANQVDFDSSSGNASMYLQVSTDATWSGVWVQFTDANSYNISLNASWTSLSDDVNPFVIRNASGNVTVTCYFRLDLDGGITSAGTFTVANTQWKITHKYETTW